MTAAHPLHVTAECHTAPGRAPIGRVTTAVYRYPTPQPEADGTLTWDATAVAVTLEADGRSGLGWTYSSASAADIIRHDLAGLVHGRDAYDVTAGWEAMHRAWRNLGTRGLYMQALSAVDIAWWDLKARLLDLPLTATRRSGAVVALGRLHEHKDQDR